MMDSLLKTAAAAVLACCISQALPAHCAGSGSAIVNDLNLMENRFFFRLYSRDPAEKRLERLELLVFGTTQSGTNDERTARLKATIKKKDAASSNLSRSKSDEHAGPTLPAPVHGGVPDKGKSSQYPILNTLEWRALKKTYGNESLDQRLERLETKLFGAASPAMAYADRVERLKRTLGVGAQNIPSGPAGPPGPMPRARPHSGNLLPGMPGPDIFEPFGTMPAPQFGMMPGMTDMLKQMQRQMEQLRHMPSGVWQWDQGSGKWIEKNTGKQLGPNQMPPDLFPANPSFPSPSFPGPANPFPKSPLPFKQRQSPAIPPYDDPNSI